jgi:uncharacterized protein (TIGR03083 family)
VAEKVNTPAMDPRAVVGGTQIADAAAWLTRTLTALRGRDWSVTVPHLGWSVGQTVAHSARSALWCAIDLTAGPTELRTIRIDVDGGAAPEELLRTVGSAAQLAAYAVDSAAPAVVGFDPDGPADASGFAAMCSDELLVHGWDAAQGLDMTPEPDPQLAAVVLARLFPWVSPAPDPWSALLWANGRIALPGQPKQQSWAWHVAPLSQWNGRPLTG